MATIPESLNTKVLVSRTYVERIERENELFHCHLRNLEIGVAKRLEKVVEGTLRNLVPKAKRPSHTAPLPSAKKATSTSRKGRSTRVGTNATIKVTKTRSSHVGGVGKWREKNKSN